MKDKIHWQLENSLAIIYWSIALISFFLGAIFILEKAEVHWKSVMFLLIFFSLIYFSRQRFIIFQRDGLVIHYARWWKNKFLPYQKITEIDLSDNNVHIQSALAEYHFRLSKKEKERFLKNIKKEESSVKIIIHTL
ncbi:hypothetical protein IV487_11790 [Enterococcus saccharolyticus]|uniref:Pore-forming protein n=1 Tax=Candidatus Enterococcus willemsii TaxID=1857215 RepID=A0ABQ6YW48_9ENTE|nr:MULTISPECIES: EbsA family protein [Enterococcus]KAF1301493.1 hypothetical protein BAU17_06110 [Enterococcus sp. CU12B]MCD5003144.1 hypothetical protein [Enterococcus saccharolyticus]